MYYFRCFPLILFQNHSRGKKKKKTISFFYISYTVSRLFTITNASQTHTALLLLWVLLTVSYTLTKRTQFVARDLTLSVLIVYTFPTTARLLSWHWGYAYFSYFISNYYAIDRLVVNIIVISVPLQSFTSLRPVLNVGLDYLRHNDVMIYSRHLRNKNPEIFVNLHENL